MQLNAHLDLQIDVGILEWYLDALYEQACWWRNVYEKNCHML